jgi:predicted metal-dependent hydrolase
MKLKTLRKKIRRLEARLQKGPKKLAKLKQKLEAITAANARKAKRKLAARVARQTAKSLTRIEKKLPAKTANAKKPSAVQKVKKKLNLSPERRAQLAAAMKARWAAKRAAAEVNATSASTDGDSTIGEAPQAL